MPYTFRFKFGGGNGDSTRDRRMTLPAASKAAGGATSTLKVDPGLLSLALEAIVASF